MASRRPSPSRRPGKEAQRPLLYLDVDGVLNVPADPELSRSAGWKAPLRQIDVTVVRTHITTEHTFAYRISVREDTIDAVRKLTSRFEVVWCTSWGDAAAVELAQALDLPAFEFIPPEHRLSDLVQAWKAPGIAAHNTQLRPFAFVDDNALWWMRLGVWGHPARCRSGLRAPRCELAHLGPHLLIRPDAHEGLTVGHVTALERFADDQTRLARSA